MLEFMVCNQKIMRGSLCIFIISCTFSYGSIIDNKDAAKAKPDNTKLDYLAMNKDKHGWSTLYEQWQAKQRKKRSITKRQAPPDWVLREAARQGITELLVWYIPLVEDIDAPDPAGWSALMLAIFEKHWDIVRILLDHGANVNHINNKKENPLHWATYWQNEELVVELIDRGVNVNQQEEKGITALMGAAVLGNTNLTNILLDAGADKQLRDIFDRTALIYAALRGKTEVEDILADFENINDYDIDGLTAVHHSVLLKNHISTLEEALTHCPNLTIEDKYGNTAEEVAAHVGNTDAYNAIQRHKRELANGCFLDFGLYEAISKEFFDCREFQCHCYGNWTSTGKDDPSCAPKTVKVYSIQEMIAPWIAHYFSLTTQTPE